MAYPFPETLGITFSVVDVADGAEAGLDSRLIFRLTLLSLTTRNSLLTPARTKILSQTVERNIIELPPFLLDK